MNVRYKWNNRRGRRVPICRVKPGEIFIYADVRPLIFYQRPFSGKNDPIYPEKCISRNCLTGKLQEYPASFYFREDKSQVIIW